MNVNNIIIYLLMTKHNIIDRIKNKEVKGVQLYEKII